MPQLNFRVLIGDDYEPWRRFIRGTLLAYEKLQVIGEASDGLEAVQKAQELQPDLVLLDIGLPNLNGIEAARQIRFVSPGSRVLFLSQVSSVDVIQEALSTGAYGYIVKMDAGSELLAALKAVRRGERFLSARFAGHDFLGALEPRVRKGSNLSKDGSVARCHEAGFYSDDRCFLDGFTRFIVNALEAKKAVVVVATAFHRESLLSRLKRHGSEFEAAVEQGRYISLDAAETLSTFMIQNMPDPDRFLEAANALITRASKALKEKDTGVVACGECAPLLWREGNTGAAIQLERLWDEVATSRSLDILCGYPLRSFEGERGSHVFDKICAEHSNVHTS